MSTTETAQMPSRVSSKWILFALAALTAAAGFANLIGAGWGYGIFLLATLFLVAGVILAGIYFMSRAFNGDDLRRALVGAFAAGGWLYVLAVAALAGHYAHETLAGRMDLRWIIFGPAVLAAIVALDVGLYRIIYGRNRATLQRYGHVISRDNLQPDAVRSTFVDEVLVHRSLLGVSPFRWLRHQLILWGFGVMFAIELLAVVFREAWPAFGFRDIWREDGHPLRLAFDVAYDLTGLMVLVGCILALVFRVMVHGKPEQKYTDTPTTLFLLAVVVTGFLLEGLRLAHAPDPASVEFVGKAFAAALSGVSVSPRAEAVLWYVHVLLSCGFIAYVPAKRMIHSCATPLGRLVNSQKTMLALKKERSLRGLLHRQSFMTPMVTPDHDRND